ncbi:MAG: ribbon-helix-helix protein, CopG family [Acidimicrobiales bacterium]
MKPLDPESPSERVIFRIPLGALANIDRVAAKRGTTRSEVIRTAVAAVAARELEEEAPAS